VSSIKELAGSFSFFLLIRSVSFLWFVKKRRNQGDVAENLNFSYAEAMGSEGGE
jgi:hypothetical protein